MKIKITKPIAGKDFSYAPGEEVNIVKARAESYIKSGVAIAVEEDKKKGDGDADDS